MRKCRLSKANSIRTMLCKSRHHCVEHQKLDMGMAVGILVVKPLCAQLAPPIACGGSKMSARGD
eukprot:4590917-Prymnesium_polylepis.1